MRGTAQLTAVKSPSNNGECDVKIGLYVDSNSAYYTLKMRFGGKLSYQKLIDYARGHGDIEEAIVYGIHITNEADKFIDCLSKLGYKTKFQKRELGSSDCDYQLAIDSLTAAIYDYLDVIILVSSSVKLAPLVELLKNEGVRVIVLSCGIPKALREAADTVYEISGDMLMV